jgi:hypothetical protein
MAVVQDMEDHSGVVLVEGVVPFEPMGGDWKGRIVGVCRALGSCLCCFCSRPGFRRDFS